MESCARVMEVWRAGERSQSIGEGGLSEGEGVDGPWLNVGDLSASITVPDIRAVGVPSITIQFTR